MMSRRPRFRRIARAVGFTLLACLGAEPERSGAAVTVTSFQGVQVVGDGADDLIAVRRFSTGSSEIDVQRTQGNGAITAGGGCTQMDVGTVRCSTGLLRANVNLGAGSDRLEVDGFPSKPFDVTADGGEGDDRFVIVFRLFDMPSGDPYAGSVGQVVFNGGSGDDTIDSGGSPDRASDDLPDTFRGGPGFDRVSYNARTETDPFGPPGVNVSLDGVANDGQPGERDNVGADFEVLVGTNKADVLTGTDDPSRRDYILGDFGRDELRGLAGDDALVGDEQADVLLGGTGDDLMWGGHKVIEIPLPADFEFGRFASGNSPTTTNDTDTLDGGPGADGLDGGPSVDVLRGGAGRDKLQTRDGVPDTISCGEDGRTLSSFDSFDSLLSDVTDPSPADCEVIDQGMVKEGPNVGLTLLSRSAARAGSVRVRVRCPRRSKVRCNGRVRAVAVGKSGKSVARATAARRFRVARGKAATRTLALSPKSRAALERVGYLQLRSVMRGKFGPMTAVTTVAVGR